MKEKGNKGAGRTGPDDGMGGEWSKINVGLSKYCTGRGRLQVYLR